MKYTVLLVAEYAIVRKGLSSILSACADFEVIGETAAGARAVDLVCALQPQLIVVGLPTTKSDNVGTLTALRAAGCNSRIAVLVMDADEDLSVSAIESGAEALLLPSMSDDALLSTLRRTAAGEPVIHASIAQRILQEVRRTRMRDVDPFAALTAREREVLRALAEGASNGRIAHALKISENTVKSHVRNVLAKLQVTDRTEAVAFAWRQGLLRTETNS
jgi:two-component system, NarL family, response regulator LiaR